jgi:hypothetical protein
LAIVLDFVSNLASVDPQATTALQVDFSGRPLAQSAVIVCD